MAESRRDIEYVIKARDEATGRFKAIERELKQTLGKRSALGEMLDIAKGGGAIAGIVGVVNVVGNLAKAQQEYLKDLERGLGQVEAKLNRMEKLAPLGLGSAGRSIGEHVVDSMLDAVEDIGDSGRWEVKGTSFLLNLFGLGDQDEKIIEERARAAAEKVVAAAGKAIADARGRAVAVGDESGERVKLAGLTGPDRERAQLEAEMKKRGDDLWKLNAKINEDQIKSGLIPDIIAPEVQTAQDALHKEQAERLWKINQDELAAQLKRSEQVADKEIEEIFRVEEQRQKAMRETREAEARYREREWDLAEEIARSNKLADEETAGFFAAPNSVRAGRGPIASADNQFGTGLLAASAEGMAIRGTAKNTERTAKAVEQIAAAMKGGRRPLSV